MKPLSLERNGSDAHLWVGPLGFHFWRPGSWSTTRPLITFDYFGKSRKSEPVAGQGRA